MPVEVNVKMNVENMTDFMFYHIYSGSVGRITLGLGALNVGCVIAFIMKGDYLMTALFLLFALLILVAFPFYIRKKVAKQMADSDRLAVNVNYKFDEEGIETTIDSENGKAEWQMFKKAAATKKNIIIYDAEKRAVILPVDQIEGEKDAILELIRKHMPASAVKIRK
mgnify:CR=1 FL=1